VSKANETSGRLALAPQPEEEQIAEAVAEEDFEESGSPRTSLSRCPTSP
jgi:hypothetical protein